MAVPFGVYPMATSDKSGEFEQMQNQKLLNAEQEYAAKAKGAQGLAGLGAGLMSAADQGLKAGMAVEDQMIDVQNLEEIYKKASENTQMMRDYAVSKLGLGPEEVKTYDPLIQSVILDSKKTRDPGSVFKFYDMVDKIAAQKEALEAKKKAGEKENVSAAISLKFAQIAEEMGNKGEVAPTFNEMRTYAAENYPELMQAYSSLDASAQRAVLGDFASSTSDIRRQESEAGSSFKDALKYYTKADPANMMSHVGSVINISDEYYKAGKNLYTAISGNESEWATRFKNFASNYLLNPGSNAVEALAKAGLPANAQAAVKQAERANGPIWQLLMTHLRNTSGAAVTDGEYARFATALGLTSANPSERIMSLAYFVGKVIASTRAKYGEATGLMGRHAMKLNEKVGRKLTDYSAPIEAMLQKIAETEAAALEKSGGTEKSPKARFVNAVRWFAKRFEENGVTEGAGSALENVPETLDEVQKDGVKEEKKATPPRAKKTVAASTSDLDNLMKEFGVE